MKTIEERINQIVEGHAECRWLDACDLRKYLEEVATEQKAIDEKSQIEEMKNLNEEWKENLRIQREILIDKACDAFCATTCKGYQDTKGRCFCDGGCKKYRAFRKAMEQ